MSILLVATITFSYAQEAEPKPVVNIKPKIDKSLQPIFILKAGDKTVKLENKSDGVSTLDDINPNQINTLTVLKDRDAISQYGEEAKNGVIVIVMKDFDSLPDRTKKLFEITDKKD